MTEGGRKEGCYDDNEVVITYVARSSRKEKFYFFGNFASIWRHKPKAPEEEGSSEIFDAPSDSSPDIIIFDTNNTKLYTQHHWNIKMSLNDEPPNEGTSLLNNDTEAAEDSIHIHRIAHLTQSSRTGAVADFSRESISIADMNRTTHNDPDVKDVSEDMSKLLGSTQILYNEMEKVTSENACIP